MRHKVVCLVSKANLITCFLPIIFPNNCKAGRQTSKCVWTRKKERKRLRGEKDDGDGGTRHKKKRNAMEKVDGFGERRHGKGWS